MEEMFIGEVMTTSLDNGFRSCGPKSQCILKSCILLNMFIFEEMTKHQSSMICITPIIYLLSQVDLLPFVLFPVFLDTFLIPPIFYWLIMFVNGRTCWKLYCIRTLHVRIRLTIPLIRILRDAAKQRLCLLRKINKIADRKRRKLLLKGSLKCW